MKDKILISKRGLKLPTSATRLLTPYAQIAKEQGVKIYNLNIGDPDIKTPEVLINQLKTWNTNPISYASSVGEDRYLDALVKYYNNLKLCKITKEDIIAAVGGSEAILMALFAVTDIDDEVLIFEPFYTNYSGYGAINGIKLIPISTAIDTGFHLPVKTEIEKHITPKTKAILYCSPNNPTGTVYTKEEIEMLVQIAKKHNLFLIADEAYREYVFDNKKSVSLLSYFDVIPNNAVIIDSLSKRYSLCGARLGAMVTRNKNIISIATKMAQARLSAGLIEQFIASKINLVPKSYFQKVRLEYQKRRDFLYRSLSNIPGVILSNPEGSFYIMVSLPVKDASAFCIFLLKDFRLNNETVMLAPGNGFYETSGKGVREVRIAYVLNVKDLTTSMKIIQKALKEYKD